ncbi:MAG: hypothetical protein AB1705_22545 [Verrucomicrobiota bacterium]
MMARFVPVVILLWMSLAPARAQEKATPGPAAPGNWKLLFSDGRDVVEPWGKLDFGVTPVQMIRTVENPGFAVIACFPRPDGAWDVFGRNSTEIERGNEPYDRVVAWKLIRATTRDGVKFENTETVFEPERAAWTDNFAMAHNPEAKEYLLLNLKMDRGGAGYRAFFSADGRQWKEHPGEPLFYDGDAMSLFWSPALRRFVCVSKSLQPHRKRLQDHGGVTPSLGDNSLRDRRVLMIRSSPDGRHWEPDVSMPDVWNRHGRKGAIPAGFLTLPDADDPPDLEFYSGNGFWYHDRCYMMVLNYAASPLLPRKHAPQLDNEWWTSRDGLRWERPARGVNALGAFPAVARLETSPMIAGGLILFPRGNQLLGLKQDRISFVTARANAEFSTAPFVMPAADLLLNAASPSPERLFAQQQAYVMAAVLDEKGNVIPDFEAEKCLIKSADDIALPLNWNGTSARKLAGRRISLRFFLRGANIYAVTAKP